MGLDRVILSCHSQRGYLRTAVDRYSRVAFARAYVSHSSAASADFLHRLPLLVGEELAHIQNDTGSEFHLHFEKAVQALKLWQRCSTPRSPAATRTAPASGARAAESQRTPQ